jgi:recombination protein RecA
MPAIVRKKSKSLVDEVEESANSPFSFTPSDSGIFVSTGSTLLDLAISGGRVDGGGIPGGIMIELYGGPGAGKTALAMEICASAQNRGGSAIVADPEARLDHEYARIYGAELAADSYFRPNTVLDTKNDSGKVTEQGLEGIIKAWSPTNEDAINVLIADSIAALSTTMEMESGDKRGQKKAKELHALCRTTARLISADNRLVVFTNQLTAGEWGEESPGGVAIKFYASLRIQIKQKGQIIKVRKNKFGKEVKKVIGIESECFVRKSSVDDPYRYAPIYLIFGTGIDDVRSNLQYQKDMTKSTTYDCTDGKTYSAMDKAIEYIENNGLEHELRKRVIEIWQDAESIFQTARKQKVRF